MYHYIAMSIEKKILVPKTTQTLEKKNDNIPSFTLSVKMLNFS